MGHSDLSEAAEVRGRSGLGDSDASLDDDRFARLTARLAAAGFGLRPTCWGIYIVATGVQSRTLATVCCAANALQEWVG